MWLITFECDLLEHDFRLSEVRRTGVLVVAIDCCPHVYIVYILPVLLLSPVLPFSSSLLSPQHSSYDGDDVHCNDQTKFQRLVEALPCRTGTTR